VDETTLLTDSGHAGVTMLRRCLGLNRKGEAIARLARAAAVHRHSGTA
jgi:3-methyladenine DNA glycosylase/8-oxoguanine DNA glycosylase